MIRTEHILFGPEDHGQPMTPEEFDIADGVEGWRYELINGVLIVSPTPKQPSRGMAGRLLHLLESYCDRLGKGIEFLTVLFEQDVRIPNGNRRRCDLAIFLNLQRNPRRSDAPTIAVEFVSQDARDVQRDYVDKRSEYLDARVKEYWIIDRQRSTMTVLTRRGSRWSERTLEEGEIYATKLMPGFKLDFGKELLARAVALEDEDDEEDD